MGNTNLQMGMDRIDNTIKSLNKQSIQPNRIKNKQLIKLKQTIKVKLIGKIIFLVFYL